MNQMNVYVEDLLPLCTQRLLISTNTDDEKLIKQNCEKTAAATEILIYILLVVCFYCYILVGHGYTNSEKTTNRSYLTYSTILGNNY